MQRACCPRPRGAPETRCPAAGAGRGNRGRHRPKGSRFQKAQEQSELGRQPFHTRCERGGAPARPGTTPPVPEHLRPLARTRSSHGCRSPALVSSGDSSTWTCRAESSAWRNTGRTQSASPWPNGLPALCTDPRCPQAHTATELTSASSKGACESAWETKIIRLSEFTCWVAVRGFLTIGF